MNIAYNMDCLKAMMEMPDKYYDLAVVDPPYGNALTDKAGGGKPWNRFGERFDRYKNSSGGVARQAEIPPRCISSGRTSDNRTEHGVMRTGGTWAAKFTKKSLRGTLPRNRNILKNCFASHETRLSGGAIISTCRRHGAF